MEVLVRPLPMVSPVSVVLMWLALFPGLRRGTERACTVASQWCVRAPRLQVGPVFGGERDAAAGLKAGWLHGD